MYQCTWLRGGSPLVLPLTRISGLVWASCFIMLPLASVVGIGPTTIKLSTELGTCQRQPLEVSSGVVNRATWSGWDM